MKTHLHNLIIPPWQAPERCPRGGGGGGGRGARAQLGCEMCTRKPGWESLSPAPDPQRQSSESHNGLRIKCRSRRYWHKLKIKANSFQTPVRASLPGSLSGHRIHRDLLSLWAPARGWSIFCVQPIYRATETTSSFRPHFRSPSAGPRGLEVIRTGPCPGGRGVSGHCSVFVMGWRTQENQTPVSLHPA